MTVVAFDRPRLVGDRWDGVTDHEWSIERATREEFDDALDRLDARVYTMMTIQGGVDAHLTIGGGAGRYVVYATFDNKEFWSLSSAERSEGMVMVNAGGQVGDYPAESVVTKSQARAAGRVFLESLRLDPEQVWTKQ